MFTPEQRSMLEAKLDKAHVKTRSQAGRTFSYIEAWQATAECNAVFGHEGWDAETVDIRLVSEKDVLIGKRDDKPGYPGWGVSYVCKVRVTVRAGEHVVVREGVGAGHGIDRDLGQAHESAIKEAESDALKRALKSFGWRFGLALYDKDQEHVSDGPDANALIAQIEGMPTEVALKAWGREYEATINALSEHDIKRVGAAYKTRLAALKPISVAAE